MEFTIVKMGYILFKEKVDGERKVECMRSGMRREEDNKN